MKEILDNLSVGIVILTVDGSVSFANRFCRDRGLVSEEFEGMKYYEVFKSLELIGFVNELLGGRPKVLEFEHSGRVYRAFPLGDRSFQIEDLTEVSRYGKLQREFTASVSHELSTPLTAVKGLLETALLQEVPSRELLEKALKRLGDLEKLINSLRFLVLLSSGQKPVMNTFQLRSLVEEVLEDLKEEIAKRDLKIELRGEEIYVRSDREKLYILLKNLVENAVRYNREGGKVSVSIEKGSRGTRITIEDTGEGIRREDMPLIFEPFLGGRNRKGMGLGLAISKRIADFLGAKLSVRSEEGKGTTAEVLLP